MFKKLFGTILILALFTAAVSAQYERSDSGGVLSAEQAAYDVKHYDLNLRLDIPNQSIKGAVIVKAEIVKPTDKFVLDLDTPFTVESVEMLSLSLRPSTADFNSSLRFERRQGKIWIKFPQRQSAGSMVWVRVAYGGKPHVAENAPWDGGFVWEKTPGGQPWIAVACETEGADLWFPVKDHPSDEPDTVALHYTVPGDLYAAGNGKLQSVTSNKDGTKTYNWYVSQPINNYNITLAIAPYRLIEDKMQSISGDTIPIQFYVLPEHFAKGSSLVALIKKYTAFLEQYLGPFPFRSEKLGVVETPFLGMEHQTLIAYGNNFDYENGDDSLLLHELGHEWWGNLVSADDWRDFWIHEGFQSFMDDLYIEKMRGKAAYFATMKDRYEHLKNVRAVAPREPRTQIEMSYIAPAYTKDDGDVYDKGALILHALRFYIGEEAFFRALRRMAYPNAEMEKITNGKQTRFASTDDFLKITEKESGKDLDWFFEVYLRQPKLPLLIYTLRGKGEVNLQWITPNNLPFPMPVEVQLGNEYRRVEMPNGKATIAVPPGVRFNLDPNGWVLKELKAAAIVRSP